MIPLAEALDGIDLTSDEERAAKKLEAAIDTDLRTKFDGGPIRLQFDEEISRRVAFAVCRRYEESSKGAWRVAPVFGRPFGFAFTPNFAVLDSPEVRATTAMPHVFQGSVEAPRCSDDFRLLVRMPTRGRPRQALEVLQKYREMAGCPIAIEVVIDEDDETMLACDVQQRLAALGCVVTVGAHKSKIAACNGGRLKEWDILLLASDDMVPVRKGYAQRVVSAMREHWPHLDGAIYFDDGFQHENCCTMSIFGRLLYEQFGYVYFPQYQSLFCDQEQTDLLRAMGRLTYVDEVIVEHRHPVTGTVARDALYDRNDSLWNADKAIYEQRATVVKPYGKWAFNSPPIVLSICIAALPARRAQLDRLLDHLWTQILALDEPREVEVLVDSRVEPTIGEKRQVLLERARGRFVAFIDDDDGVSHDYISRVVGTLRGNPEADCASLTGVMTTAGAVPERFYSSITCTGNYTQGETYYRWPNHLNAIRRDLALQVGFKAISHGEDIDYAVRLRPLLRHEASTGERPLYLYYYQPSKAA